MSNKSKRQLEKELERLKGPTDTVMGVTSRVVTITDGMTDNHGKLIEENAPDPQLPQGYERGEELVTGSPVVTAHRCHLVE